MGARIVGGDPMKRTALAAIAIFVAASLVVAPSVEARPLVPDPNDLPILVLCWPYVDADRPFVAFVCGIFGKDVTCAQVEWGEQVGPVFIGGPNKCVIGVYVGLHPVLSSLGGPAFDLHARCEPGPGTYETTCHVYHDQVSRSLGIRCGTFPNNGYGAECTLIDVFDLQCIQMQWGAHGQDIRVGGNHACHVIVWADPQI